MHRERVMKYEYAMPKVPLSLGPDFQDATESVDMTPNADHIVAFELLIALGTLNEGMHIIPPYTAPSIL
jgi:hypothetical protein